MKTPSGFLGALAAIALLIATPALAGEAPKAEPEKKESKNAEFKTKKEKVSYCIGANLGKMFQLQGLDIDTAVLLKGIADGVAEKSLFTDEEARAIMAEWQKSLPERNAKAGEAFLAENAKKEGVKTTASGLQYKVMTSGKGKSPKATDTVVANYRGTLINGTEFDSSYKRGEPLTIRVDKVVPGWTEALQLMKEGDKWQLFVPGKLGYGAQPGPGGPNSALLFEVELISVKDTPPAEEKEDTQKPEIELGD